jgi:murein DD-endopeptidase MepM/ murein hydrolase activator NlpD
MRSMISLQNGVRTMMYGVRETRGKLEKEQEARRDKQAAVAERKKALEEAKIALEDERALKDAIIAETKASELHFRYLLAELKQEQDEADTEIEYLERVLREKLQIADRVKGDGAVLSWPVTPARGLSTRFRDPEYPFRYIFEHPGIDIRAGQGTPVRASAAGFVARAKNAGMGYSYVMLIHNNDISTVYGHLSKILVKEDSYVERGEIIGYSGGMPGTLGAGRLTTGPHLHFETRQRGLPVDPLRHLMSF